MHKMIWSYLPIFCLLFSFLFFVFFQTLVQQNNRNTKESSEVFVNQLLQSVDISLRSLDNMLIRDFVSNKLLSDFFQERGKDNVYLNYQIVNQMQLMKQAMPMIDSYYLVRYKDGIVFNGNTKSMDQFADIDFIRSQQRAKATYISTWSAFRTYGEFESQKPKDVISLVHNVSFSSSKDGMIVVNISLASLRMMMREMYEPGQSFVQLYDNEGQPLFKQDGGAGKRKVLASQTSRYTGWTAESGITNGRTGELISSLSSVWLVLGLLSFVAGGASIVYVTRKNYKPIADLVFRIQDQFGTGKPTLGRLAVDEFTFIETAINNFAEQTELFRKEARETAARKQKSLFRELLLTAGEQTEWLEPSLLPPHDRLRVFVLEIDHPEQMFNQYKLRDQSLFKFVVSSASHELFTAQPDVQVWLEWTSPLQMTGILFMNGAAEDTAAETAAHITDWVSRHLAFSVTIGLGETEEAGAGAAGESHKQAQKALSYKATLGHNRVIGGPDTAMQQTEKATNKHLQAIHLLIRQLRLHEEAWQESCDHFFAGMRACRLTKSEIAELCRYFAAHMDVQLSEASKEYYEYWVNETAPSLRQIIEEFDTLEELQRLCAGTLARFAAQMERLHGSRQHHQLLQEIRSYIGLHYANPELSLEFLGDKFGLNAKYISQLFKEEFGENFLDYLTQLRIMAAKKQLLEHPDSIQEVGERVGYVSAATFRRVFRKVEGLSPVDYRKRNAM